MHIIVFYDTIICIMAIISLIFDYDIHYKWQLFLMTIMDCTMLTRKLLGLPAHKHLLHRLSKTSPLHLRHLCKVSVRVSRSSL